MMLQDAGCQANFKMPTQKPVLLAVRDVPFEGWLSTLLLNNINIIVISMSSTKINLNNIHLD